MTKLSSATKGVSNSPKPISTNIFHFPLLFWSLPSQTQTIFPFPTSHFFLPFSHKPKHQLPTLCLPVTLCLTNSPFPSKLTLTSTLLLPHPQPKLTPTTPLISFLSSNADLSKPSLKLISLTLPSPWAPLSSTLPNALLTNTPPLTINELTGKVRLSFCFLFFFFTLFGY